jgi:hypothetical protein
LADLIFSPYFTKDIKFHQHDSSNGGKGGSLPNDYEQMRGWYESVKRIGVDAVIIHNELSDEFIDRYQTDKIQFIRWEKQNRPSYNDERFYAYYEYITLHEDITRVICTDLYDVVFYQNPFDLMNKQPEYDVFAGSEHTGKWSAKWMINKCKEMKFPTSRQNFSSPFMYNAGIMGGTRERMLQLFKCMIDCFSQIDKRFNANMPVYNHCLDQLEFFKIFTGFPLHNVFNSNKVTNGLYIKHK